MMGPEIRKALRLASFHTEAYWPSSVIAELCDAADARDAEVERAKTDARHQVEGARENAERRIAMAVREADERALSLNSALAERVKVLEAELARLKVAR